MVEDGLDGMNLEGLTLVAARTAVAEGRVSAVALAEQHYARIAQVDGPTGQGINSYLALSRERALAQAERVDGMVAAGGDLPILAGVPIGVKDVLAMQGAPATAGSKILAGYLPPYDATVVRKLEAAGAVLLGKLNCDEFAMGSSNENSAYGPVRNPRALDRVPGGSSGGSAAAVAADLCVASLGTDTGGSVRQPAAFCGVVGVLPTYGRVSRYGLIAFASSLDRVGPLTKTVQDAAILMEVLAGSDVCDATTSNRQVPNYSAGLQEPVVGSASGRAGRVLWRGARSRDPGRLWSCAIEGLREHGCEIKPVALPHTQYAIPAYYVLATAEASSNSIPLRRSSLRFAGRDTQLRWAACSGRRATRGLARRLSGGSCSGTYSLSSGYYDAYYRKAQQVRTLLTRDFLAAFSEVDVLVGPMTPTPPFKLGEKTDDPVAMYLADIYSVAASLAGLPAVSVPCGGDRRRAADRRTGDGSTLRRKHNAAGRCSH